jgi:hypothetical protein
MDNQNTEPEKKESYVLIRFTGVGEAQFAFTFENVSPAQILGAVSILEVVAKNEFITGENARREQQAQNHIAVPKSHIDIGRK